MSAGSERIGELYPRWLAFLFDRPTPDWYFELDAGEFETEGEHALMAELVAMTCRRAGRDLRHYTDAQVNAGFSYIFDNGASNVVFSLMARELPLAAKLDCIDALVPLYADCFRLRCDETLGHLSERGNNPLNHICYMLGDMSPLTYWADDPDAARLYEALADAFGRVLRVPHAGCIEGALHALGHMCHCARPPVETAIDAWLAGGPAVRPELLAYAASARTGCVL